MCDLQSMVVEPHRLVMPVRPADWPMRVPSGGKVPRFLPANPLSKKPQTKVQKLLAKEFPGTSKRSEGGRSSTRGLPEKGDLTMQ